MTTTTRTRTTKTALEKAECRFVNYRTTIRGWTREEAERNLEHFRQAIAARNMQEILSWVNCPVEKSKPTARAVFSAATGMLIGPRDRMIDARDVVTRWAKSKSTPAEVLQAGVDSGRVIVATCGPIGTPKPPAPKAATPAATERAPVPDFAPDGFGEPKVITGLSRKGRKWVAILTPDRLEESDFRRVFERVKGIGGWYKRAWDGQPGGFAVWAEDRAKLAAILAG